jgi:hypothetical protein
MKAPAIASLLFLLAPACASRPLVRADDMSAAEHRNEAERDQAAAAGETRAYKQGAGGTPASPAAYDPNDRHRRRAEESREHARQHAAAAAFLEQFEDEECSGVPPSSRAACPLLGPLVGLDDVPGGVRATFVDRARARRATAEMRCHYAFARARHFAETVSCPLYVKGIEVRPGLDLRSVEIVARDQETVRAIRERSREQAVFVRRDR